MYLSQTSVPVRSTLRHDHERDRENKTNRTINHPGHGGTDARAIPVLARRVITGPSRTLRPPASAVPAALGSGSGPSAAETRPLLPRIGRRGCSARSAQRGERGMDSRGVAPYYGHGCTWTVGYGARGLLVWRTSAPFTAHMAFRTASATSFRTAAFRHAFGSHVICTKGMLRSCSSTSALTSFEGGEKRGCV